VYIDSRDFRFEMRILIQLLFPCFPIIFEYGFNTNFLKKVGQHWLDKYDWKAREKELNKYSHFKTKISGIDVHFLHVKSSNNQKYKKTEPLLLLHGWPGSFVEFYKVIPMLTDPQGSDINFELVIPSIPGYGFSEAAHRPGFGAVEAAQIFLKLMQRLGFKEFYIQGGDWGSAIATNLAALYPKHVTGIHLNMCASLHPRSFLKSFFASLLPLPSFLVDQKDVDRSMQKNFGALLRETGYLHLQATKPDTIGVSLSNSPTGLAAYILEKFSGWTNMDWISKEDGGLTPYYKLDELLDNVMIYWVTNSITSSMRFYAETLSLRERKHEMDRVPVTVPAACLNTPKEFYFSPRFMVEDKYNNLVRYTNAEKGGHFAAFEVPQIVANDVIAFVQQLESSGKQNTKN